LPVLNRIAGFSDEMKEWRQHLHKIPEIDFDLPKTAAFVADKLREFGVDALHEGIAQTGMVALIHGKGEGPVIGLRADMDALPMGEETGLDYASTHSGAMHACGHDGHTTMLLGAAKYLAETRNFAGTVALIFQPAEEFGGGGRVMCEEGILDRFNIGQVYALHNAPGTPVGHFYTNPGPIMAAQDTFRIYIKGQGGHGAMPHETRDPVVAALAIGTSLQTIVSRNHYAFNELVLSVTQVQTGTADNVIPEYAFVGGTVRTFDKAVQAMVMRRMQALVDGHAAAYDVEVKLEYDVGYPATINHEAETGFAARVAAEIVGEDAVTAESTPEMGAEDFAYLLEECPGCYLFIGNGDSAGLHQTTYNFNDETAPVGASFFARLVETAQPVKGA